MADVKWIKITTDMFEDEKIDFITSLPESDAILVIWIRLLALAGKCNSGGYIHLSETIPYTEDMLAHRFRKPLSIIKLSIETFKRLGMLDLDEGGLFLPNWDKHQNVEGLEKIRERDRERKKKERSIKKLLLLEEDMSMDSHVTVTGHVHGCPQTDIDKELDKELDIINNDNNARVGAEIDIKVNDSGGTLSEISQTTNEIPQIVNESNKTVSKTNETLSMAIGTIAVNWAEKNWGRMIPKGESDQIIAWCDEFSTKGSKDPDGVVIEGLRCCLDADARNMFYLRRVMTDWSESGVLTVAQAKIREAGLKSPKEPKRNKDPGDKPLKQKSDKYEKFYL